nr:MAG TPA: hypothetical protein [Caudoviricetes sp.]
MYGVEIHGHIIRYHCNLKDNSMKIDFRKIVVYDIEGNVMTKEIEKKDSEGNSIGTEIIPDYRDLSKNLGNAIFFNVEDINEQEIGRKIYHDGEIEIDEARAALIKRFAEKIFYAYIKVPLFQLLDEAIEKSKTENL